MGMEGVVIGCGQECDITLPLEAGLEDRHIQLKWVPGTYMHIIQTRFNVRTCTCVSNRALARLKIMHSSEHHFVHRLMNG